ncbi:hypothetical protein Q8F55_000793 [Vanrija albida]|uniref:Polysaccharide lyase 14 domain-containing protein n=1 Tax=Vanrija albida TaxID=181172 RepID=A0ABR3QEA2_9TREE
MLPSLIAALLLPVAANAAGKLTIDEVASRYGLSTNFNFSQPSGQLDSGGAQKYLVKNWNLNGDHIDFGLNDISFVNDPAGDKGDAVLKINYPKGSYSGQTGGTQFYAQPLNATSSTPHLAGNATSDGQFERMLLAYDIYFDEGFQWNLGGKLPGLRGGSDVFSCSGGHQTDGTKCFSTRLMWRSSGNGEVYAYIPTTKNFCQQNSYVICNSDFGTSIERGAFGFQSGKWQTIWLYVALNTPGIDNGELAIWYNGVNAFQLNELNFRSSASIESIGGLYFSTFFGGYDSSWASPSSQNTYYRNVQLIGGLGAANGTGKPSAARAAVASPTLAAVCGATLVSVLALVSHFI